MSPTTTPHVVLDPSGRPVTGASSWAEAARVADVYTRTTHKLHTIAPAALKVLRVAS